MPTIDFRYGVRLTGLLFIATLDCAVPRDRAPSPPAPESPVAPTPVDAGHAFCVPPTFRQTRLEAAWPEADRIVACVREEPADPEGGKGERTCIESRSAGDFGAAPSVVQAEPRFASAPFRRVSRDGHLRFEIVGGARRPHRAIGILRDAQTGRVLKRAPIEYDEHIEFVGWVGQAIVLRIYVEEGPGDGLFWLYPERTWPISIASHLDEDAGVSLIDCFDGCAVLQPSDGTFAIVDASGSAVTFVDEATMAVDVVTTGHASYPEMGRRQVRWMEGDGILAIVYGAPESGVVARIDLTQKKLLSVRVPPECAAAP